VGKKKTLPTLHYYSVYNVGKLVLQYLTSVHPETPIKIPTLALWTPNNGHLGIQSFSFGRVSGWALTMNAILHTGTT